MRKDEFHEMVFKWVANFDRDFALDELNGEPYIKDILKSSTPNQFYVAACWVEQHFHRLSLGCNMAWAFALSSLIKHLKKQGSSRVGKGFEKNLITKLNKSIS